MSSNVPMSLCDNVFLHMMQTVINPVAANSNRRRAVATDLPHLYFCCQMTNAKEMDGTDWPASMLLDGVSRKHGVRFEAFYSWVSSFQQIAI
jgi:hypothetical protein